MPDRLEREGGIAKDTQEGARETKERQRKGPSTNDIH